jgi:hypothetical protein
MSITSLGRIVLVCVAASVGLDANQAHPLLGQAAAKGALKLGTTLNTCVSRGNLGMDPVRPSALASDRKRHDEGRRIQIVGGLVPSANISAQAGALNPAVAAMAAAGGSARTGAAPEPDVRIEPEQFIIEFPGQERPRSRGDPCQLSSNVQRSAQ